MNTGVSTVPWGKVSAPDRAAPDRPSIQKSNMNQRGTWKWERGTESCDSVPRSAFRVPRSDDEHRIAITIEPIALPHRLPIGFHHPLRTAERTDQHEQRRAGQVKVRDQPVNDVEIEPRTNEQARLSRTRANPPSGNRCRLQRAHDGSSDRPHASFSLFDFVHPIRRAFRALVDL